MENQQLISPSRQCSSTPVCFGSRISSQRTTWQHYSIPHTLLTWLKLIFTCSLHWNQHWSDSAFVMLLTSLRMRRKSWKGFHKIEFPTTLQSLVEVYGCTRGLFWEKCNFSVCTVLYYRKWSESGSILKLPRTV
jgi:hypothetical protein